MTSGTPRRVHLLSTGALGGMLTCCPLMLVAHYVAGDQTMVMACLWAAMLLMVVGLSLLPLGPWPARDKGDDGDGWGRGDDPPPPLPEPAPVAERKDYQLAA